MTTTIITPEILTFAREVRAALADLPADERDELTDGLEADLAEAYAEDLSRALPDPGEYALELRNAAGLPQGEGVKEGLVATLGLSARRARADLGRVVRDNPALTSVADFLASLRPFWWVARAWTAAWLVAAFFGLETGFLPSALLSWLVLAVFVLVSVQWGRGRWRFPGLAPVIVVGNVLAAALLVPVAHAASEWSNDVSYSYVDGDPSDPTGLFLDGQQVGNIFPFDADGKPLTGVQLFDEQGRPLRAMVEGADGCVDPDCTVYGTWVARALTNGDLARNVYPALIKPQDVDAVGAEVDLPDVVRPGRPFQQAPAVVPLKVAPSND